MIAFAVLMMFVAMFWLGRLVGRQEASVAVITHFAAIYKRLSIEDKLLFDKWMKDYEEFIKRKPTDS